MLSIIAATGGIACTSETPNEDTFGFDPMDTGATAMDGGDSTAGDDDDGDGATMAGSGDSGADDDGMNTGDETGDPPGDGEHALGTVVIGETHPVGTGNAIAILNATFVPDATAAEVESCGMAFGDCEVLSPPMCALGCAVGETCVYGANCMGTCQAPCDAVCAADEVCYFPFPGTSACKKIETFDAGRLDFFGTIVPITLYPPYTLPPGTEGPLTQPDNAVTVRASGAVAAGFAEFEAMTMTGAPVFSTLEDILPADAFGANDLMIGWLAGTADMTITLNVTGMISTSGTVVCEADDTLGAFSVPRMAINAAVEGDTPASIAVALQRSATMTTMGLMTQGQLLEQAVQPEGWVDFTFVSIETGVLTPM